MRKKSKKKRKKKKRKKKRLKKKRRKLKKKRKRKILLKKQMKNKHKELYFYKGNGVLCLFEKIKSCQKTRLGAGESDSSTRPDATLPVGQITNHCPQGQESKKIKSCQKTRLGAGDVTRTHDLMQHCP